jgi:asparagine synthase (glutamine-hydrolysing)
MSSSVEIRVPYCNVQIAELMNSMTTSHKTKSLEKPKLLLKMIAEKYLPKELVWRNKIGFGIPLEDWFRQSGGLNSFIKYLKDDRFKDRQIYNLSFVDKLISDHLSAKANNGRILWTLLNIELWHRIFIDKSIDPLALN